MKTLDEFTGVDLAIVGMAVAKAIRSTRKFGAKEHEAAMASIIAAGGPSLGANLARIGNVSAIRQELEKAGLLDGGQPSAFARAVGEAVDELAAAKKS